MLLREIQTQITKTRGGQPGHRRRGARPRHGQGAQCDLAIIDKRRPKANVAEVMNIIGEIEGKTCHDRR